MQTVWKGSISFGLVSIPVRLVSATEEKDVAFRQVRRSDGSRIRYRRVAEADGAEVAYSDIAKGYELPDGDIVVLTDDDLADLPLSSGRSVEVLSFVPFSDIDPTALAKAYYCDPSGDAKPYVLLSEALEASGRVAVVKVALRNRERLAVLRSRDGVLILQTMLWPDEVRAPEFGFLSEKINVRDQEMAMAASYIQAMSADFEPDDYTDEYRNVLETMLAAKVEGREIKAPAEAPADATAVVDLMEALRRSVAAAKAARSESADEAATGSGGADAMSDTENAEPESQAAAASATPKPKRRRASGE